MRISTREGRGGEAGGGHPPPADGEIGDRNGVHAERYHAPVQRANRLGGGRILLRLAHGAPARTGDTKKAGHIEPPDRRDPAAHLSVARRASHNGSPDGWRHPPPPNDHPQRPPDLAL